MTSATTVMSVSFELKHGQHDDVHGDEQADGDLLQELGNCGATTLNLGREGGHSGLLPPPRRTPGRLHDRGKTLRAQPHRRALLDPCRVSRRGEKYGLAEQDRHERQS